MASWDPSVAHHIVALMTNWVANLSVGLGSTPSLITFISHIDVGEWGFEEGVQGDVLDALSPWTKQKSMNSPWDRRWYSQVMML